MQFKEALAKLKQDKLFRQWEKENPEHYLAHGFFMHDKQVQEEWQIGFYNKKDDRIVVFTVSDPVTKNPPSELFKRESGVQELLVEDIAVELDEALKLATSHREEKYRGHEPMKTIILLQKLKLGQVWNITFVTSNFTVCNIKLDTKTKAVLSSSCESLLGWARRDQ